MKTTTGNLKLDTFEETDNADFDYVNANMVKIDTAVSGLQNDCMKKSVYDADGDGVVDNALKVNGHTVYKDVPANAVFTDTTYTHPSYTAKSAGLYKVTVDGTGHVSATSAVAKSDITALGIPAQDTTYSAATTSAAGLMSATDKTKLDGITEGAVPRYYAVCDTAADTAEKVVTVDDTFELVVGAQVTIRFTYANSIASPKLNVNGTGAKPIYRYGTTACSTSTASSGWYAGAMQTLTYDGTGWVRDFWYNSTYSNVSLGQGYATCSTAAATTAKVGTLSSYTLTTGGIVAVKFTYAVPASATLNINSKGAKAIYHRGAAIKAGVINAGDTATLIYNGSYYHLLSVDSEPTNIATLQSKVSELETKVAALEAMLAYFVGIDDTGVYVTEGE